MPESLPPPESPTASPPDPSTAVPTAAIPEPTQPSAARSLRAWLFEPAARNRQGRLAIAYAGWVRVTWCLLTAIGFGYVLVPSTAGRSPEATFIGLGMGAVAAFVASFALRPVIAMDPTGIAVLPVFGSRVVLRWDEVTAIGVRESRRARGRGSSLEVFATEDREVKVDGLWVGLTPANLAIVERLIGDFVTAGDLTRAPIGFEPEPDPG